MSQAYGIPAHAKAQSKLVEANDRKPPQGRHRSAKKARIRQASQHGRRPSRGNYDRPFFPSAALATCRRWRTSTDTD